MADGDGSLVARLGSEDCAALRAAVSTMKERPILNHVCIHDGMAEATDGHVLVRVPLRDEQRQEVSKAHARWMLHQSVLSLVRGKHGELEIDLRTGKVQVLGKGDCYPISAPGAVTEAEVGAYPATDKVMPNGEGGRRMMLSAAVLRRLAAIAGKGGKLEFVVPAVRAGENHVSTGIRIEQHGDMPRSGVAMPMRILD